MENTECKRTEHAIEKFLLFKPKIVLHFVKSSAFQPDIWAFALSLYAYLTLETLTTNYYDYKNTTQSLI